MNTTWYQLKLYFLIQIILVESLSWEDSRWEDSRYRILTWNNSLMVFYRFLSWNNHLLSFVQYIVLLASILHHLLVAGKIIWWKVYPCNCFMVLSIDNHGWISHAWNYYFDIYSSHLFLKFLVELKEYILDRTAIFYIKYKYC